MRSNRTRKCVELALAVRSAAAADPDAAPAAARLVLRVEVEKVDGTSFYPKPDHECPPNLQCIQMYFWAKYRARVIEVIAGSWPRQDVEFLHLEHAQYVDDFLRDCCVVLSCSVRSCLLRCQVLTLVPRPRKPAHRDARSRICGRRRRRQATYKT